MEPEPSATLVFVYGTLKRGGCNHAFLARQRFLGEARTAPGYRLHHLGTFPGMVTAPDDQVGVVGEVWSVDAATLAQLDDLEGTAEGLYRREPVPLLLPFADRRVETYIYLRDIVGHPALPDGLWREA